MVRLLIAIATPVLLWTGRPACASEQGTIVFFEPRSPIAAFRGDDFVREFSRPSLATSRYRLVVTQVDHLDAEKLSAQIDQALAARPSMVVAPASRIALFARSREPRMPILFISVANPSRIDLVSNLAHPEANLTGLTYAMQDDLKFFEIARELAGPRVNVGLLVDRFWTTLPETMATVATAQKDLGLRTTVVGADTGDDAREQLAAYKGPPIDVWIILDTSLARYHGADIMKLVRARGGAVVVARRDLLDYGAHVLVEPMIERPMKTLAEMADLIARGVPVERIPVSRPKRFSIVVNVPAVERAPGFHWREVMSIADHFSRGAQ